MHATRSRSWSSETGLRTSPSASNSNQNSSRTTKATPISSVSPESKPSKLSDRKPSSKTLPSPEKRTLRVPEMQEQLAQLQEELRKAKEEKSGALEELAEVKKMKMMSSPKSSSKDRLEFLELEVEKAKESEGKMLESLISQTKQLEQTKISLEEAKLQIRSLQESIKSSEGSSRSSNTEKQEDIEMLRNELKFAMEAEEKSKKAMDGLAAALKEVTTEANKVKSQLSLTQSELEKVITEAEQTKSLLKVTEERLKVATEESERFKLESEEWVVAWNAKENSFINCMKISEEEITKAHQENMKLVDSQRVAREENSKLRDILKQAVNEATVVKETLEIARSENSQLKDQLSEKENALKSITQEYECLKVSEAAALGSVNELKSLLAATSTMDSNKTSGSTEAGSFRQPKGMVNEVTRSKGMVKFPSERWKSEAKMQNGHRHSVGESGKFKGAVLDMEHKDQIYGSISNVSELRVPSSIFTDERETLNSDEYDHIDGPQFYGMENGQDSLAKQKKKKPMLRRFGDMLRRRSFHK